MLLIDDESRSYWDHITGEAVHGPLRGHRLDVWNVTVTTMEAALARDPEITFSTSDYRSLYARFFSRLHHKKIDRRGFIPPPFRRTMEKVDGRLPENAQGLGVVDGERAVFYPLKALTAPVEEAWNGRRLTVIRDPLDGVPRAEWEDGSRPFQLFTRWYGFVLTFPGCEIHSS